MGMALAVIGMIVIFILIIIACNRIERWQLAEAIIFLVAIACTITMVLYGSHLNFAEKERDMKAFPKVQELDQCLSKLDYARQHRNKSAITMRACLAILNLDTVEVDTLSKHHRHE